MWRVQFWAGGGSVGVRRSMRGQGVWPGQAQDFLGGGAETDGHAGCRWSVGVTGGGVAGGGNARDLGDEVAGFVHDGRATRTGSKLSRDVEKENGAGEQSIGVAMLIQDLIAFAVHAGHHA